MKTFLFAAGLCAALVACGDTSEKQRSSTPVNGGQSIYLPDNGDPGPLPCDRVYILQITTEAGTVTKEVPVYCSNSIDPDHGDPPYDRTWMVDPDPWDKQTIIKVETFGEFEERQQKQSGR